jgi:hypothetical protein
LSSLTAAASAVFPSAGGAAPFSKTGELFISETR